MACARRYDSTECDGKGTSHGRRALQLTTMRKLHPPTGLDQARIATLRHAPVPVKRYLLSTRRIIGRTKSCAVFYWPRVPVPNPKAEVIFVGLTPGLSQMKKAYELVRERPGLSPKQYAVTMRKEVAFAGSMRTNLITVCDGLGLRRHLKIASTAELFGKHADRTFATSALYYPVLRRVKDGWANYSGTGAVVRSQVFTEMLETILAPTLAAMSDALVIPFGVCVEKALGYLVDHDLLDPSRVLWGFPHPSGGNGHRAAFLAANAPGMKRRLTHWIWRFAAAFKRNV